MVRASLLGMTIQIYEIPLAFPRTKDPRSYIPVFRDDDYTTRYPPDEYGMEMDSGARVGRTYLDEAEIADKDYIIDNNGTLDGILVFVSAMLASLGRSDEI